MVPQYFLLEPSWFDHSVLVTPPAGASGSSDTINLAQLPGCKSARGLETGEAWWSSAWREARGRCIDAVSTVQKVCVITLTESPPAELVNKLMNVEIKSAPRAAG